MGLETNNTEVKVPFVSYSIVSMVSNAVSLAMLTLIVQSRWGLAGLYCKILPIPILYLLVGSH